MKKRKFYFILLLLCWSFAGITQSPFTPGNIVVYRVGSGSSPIPFADETAPVFLDEFTPAGVLVQSIAMPTVASGANKPFSIAGVVSNNSMLTLSPDGRYLAAIGHAVPPGTTGTLFSQSANFPRVVGLIDYNGVINTSTALTDLSNGGQPTSAITSNGTNIWAAGNSSSGDNTNGVHYATVGSTTSTQLHGVPPAEFFGFSINGGQLYASTARDINTVGTGSPTTSGQTVTPLPGLPNGNQRHQFVLLDLNTGIPGIDVLYVADEFRGIEKYSFNGTNWVLNGTVGTSTSRYIGLTARLSGNTVTLFATRNGSNDPANIGGGDLITITDASGYNGSFSGTPTVLSSIITRFGANDIAAYRGVALVPTNPSANVSAKIFLQQFFSTGLGRHRDVTSGWAAILNANALNQPFNTAAFGNYNGGESVSSGFFTSTGATTDIVDWVLVELHDATTPSTIVAREAAFVREDGQIVGLDGTSPVSFTGVANGNYYLVVQHRNHLDVRSATTISVNGGSTASYDFTTAQSKAFQDGTITANPAMKDLGGGVFGLWGGNANSNTTVRFTGLNNDAAAILAALSANQAAVLSNVYSNADVNMDGIVRYTGLNNDAAALLSILGGNQAAVFTQHQ